MLLSKFQKDALTELINIGVGKGGAMLNDMLATPILLKVPDIHIIHFADLISKLDFERDTVISGVNLAFMGDFEGFSQIIFPKNSASKLVSVLMNEEKNTSDFDTMQAGALTEIGNIVLNGIMGSLSNFFQKKLTYIVPNYHEGTPQHFFSSEIINPDAVILFCKAQFDIQKLNIQGDVIILFTLNSFENLKREIAKLT